MPERRRATLTADPRANFALAQQRVRDRANERPAVTPVVSIDLTNRINPDTNTVTLCGFGDPQWGSRECDEARVLRDLEELYTDLHMVGILLGDFCEMATRYSVGSGVYEQTRQPQEQQDDALDLLRPGAEDGAWLAGVSSNHHRDRAMREVGLDPEASLYRELGIPYLGHAGYILARVGSQVYTIRVAHENRKNVREMAHLGFADLYLTAHLHSIDVQHDLYEVATQAGITYRRRVFARCGAYLRYDGSYAQAKALQPSDLGSVYFQLRADRHRIDPLLR